MLELIEDLGMQYATEKSKKKSRFGMYKCICGNIVRLDTYNVRSGVSKSCGCYRNKISAEINIKHGFHNHILYQTWNSMMQRCNNEKRKAYKNYGGRGIIVCERWLKVENFIEDMFPTFKKGLSIDRINPDGNYELSNCRWTDSFTQARNTRKLHSKNKSGYRGVSYYKLRNKWASCITVNRKNKFLGYFEDKIEAAKAYDNYVITNGLEHTLNFKSNIK